MTTGDRTYDANAAVVESQVRTILATANGVAIYRPGGVAGGNVYTSLLAAVDAVRSAGGGRVLVDGNLGQPTTEAVHYDFEQVTLGFALWLGATFFLNVVPGTTFSNLEVVTGGLVINNQSTAPVMSVAGTAEVLFDQGSGLISDAGCTAPFFKVLNGGQLFVNTTNLTIFDGQGNHAVLEAAAGGTAAINVAPNQTTPWAIADDTLTGPGVILVTRGLGTVKWANASASQAGTGAGFQIVPA